MFGTFLRRAAPAVGAGLALLCAAALPAAASDVRPAAPAAPHFALPQPVGADAFRPFDPKRAALGRLLFYDKVLSGNRNISCGTCHDHALASGDALSLGIGEGGIGVGPTRRLPADLSKPRERMARNSMPMFNLGHRDVHTLLNDGRVSDDDIYGAGFNSPAEEWLPPGLQSALAAQAILPMTVPVEMAGDPEESEFGAARNQRIDFVWPLVIERVMGVPAYIGMFADAYDDVEGEDDVTIAHIANAIDDFINSEWRSYWSPFDRYLAGDAGALTPVQKQGLDLFYGKANCASCHAGPLFSDQQFYALAIPPFGPGRVRDFDPHVRDIGRMAESDLIEDAYRFRTPFLRNVARTGPWGHNGAYATLEGIVRHHLDPLGALAAWDRTQVVMPKDAVYEPTDFAIWSDKLEMARYRSRVDIKPVALDDDEVRALVAFLDALTDEKGIAGRLGKPESVPSGLPLD